MNKRARMRLIAVTVVILAVVTGFLVYSGFSGGASYSKTVKDVANDQSLVGKQVKVAGKVVSGSWDKKTQPMKFKIVAEDDQAAKGPMIAVVYNGTTPSTFGDGVTAIVTGKLEQGGTITSNDMITKCPSKYENAKGLPPLSDVATAANAGKPVKGTAFVVAGSIKQVPGQGDRFVVTGKQDGSGEKIGIIYDGALPSGMADGSEVVISGQVEPGGEFVATEVALPKK